MVVLHYAGVSRNNASGVSVIVPQIMNAQTSFATVGFYNYGTESFDTVESVTHIIGTNNNDDYHTFSPPFNKPDIVIFHSPFGLPRCAIISKMLKKDGIPYVVVPHGCFSKFAMKKKSLKKNIARLVFMNRVIRNAAKMQYLSEGEKKASVYKTPSFIVPNGIFIPEYHEKLPSNPLRLSFIGRKDCYHKGLDYLIGACGEAKSELRGKIQLCIYGPATGNQNAEVESLIAINGVEDFVSNSPAVFGDEKQKAYSETDVFVLTSRFEGQPVAILEAWANGIPTLVTPGTNVSEECSTNECGWTVSLDKNAIAEQLISLANSNDDIFSKGRNAYAYVAQAYNWKNVSSLYNKEYSLIINKKTER